MYGNKQIQRRHNTRLDTEQDEELTNLAELRKHSTGHCPRAHASSRIVFNDKWGIVCYHETELCLRI